MTRASRYVPAQPVHIDDKGSSLGAAVCIVVSMFCVDIPFVIVRLWTMIEFGLIVSDLIHPLKNIAMICFGLTQLTIIYSNRKAFRKGKNVNFQEQRTLLSPLQDTWDFSQGDKTVKGKNGSSVAAEEADTSNTNDAHEAHDNGNLHYDDDVINNDITMTDIN